MAEQATEGIISLKWNNHKTTFFNVLAALRAKEFCTDATLGCEGKLYPVHKLVLCSSSDYFCEIFQETKCKSPVIILKDIRYNNLEALLDYMYLGEVEIGQKDLPDLIEAAECLRIKGLAAPDDLILTPSKELSPIKKEELSTLKSSPLDDNKFSPVTNFNDSRLVLQSSNTTFESEILPPPLKRPKQESEEDLKLNDSKNFSLLISENFCKAINSVEVPLHGHSSRHQKSMNHLPEYSSSIQKKVTENEVHISNTSIKKVQLKRKRDLKSSLSVKKSVIKNCNIDGVISVKVGHNSLNEVKKTLKSENVEEKSLRNIENIDSNHFDETKYDNRALKAKAQKNKNLDERNRLCEEFCDEIGLPKFSESLTPYILGHNLEIKERRNLANKLADELADHLDLHKMLERMEKKLRCTFYLVFQQKILEKYPNIIQEENNWKKGKKGPLSYLMNRLSVKICSLAKKNREQAVQNNESTSSNEVAENNLNLENVDEREENEDIDAIATTQHSNFAFESNPENIEVESDSFEQDEEFSLYEANS